MVDGRSSKKFWQMDGSVCSLETDFNSSVCCSHTADANAFSFVFKNTNTTWCTVQPTLQTDGSVVMCHVDVVYHYLIGIGIEN
jgi:hypothetical protein